MKPFNFLKFLVLFLFLLLLNSCTAEEIPKQDQTSDEISQPPGDPVIVNGPRP